MAENKERNLGPVNEPLATSLEEDDTESLEAEGPESVDTDDTETETSTDAEAEVDDTETETSDDDDIDAAWQELGLEKRYGSKAAALRAIAEKDRTLTQTQQEAAELRRIMAEHFQRANQQQQQPPQQPGESNEDYLERLQQDPMGTLKRDFVTRDEMRQTLSDYQQRLGAMQQERMAEQMAQSIAKYPDLRNVAEYVRTHHTDPPTGMNATWDRMMEMRARYGLQSTSGDLGGLVDLLYGYTTGGASPKAKTKQPAVSAAKKQRASTASGTNNQAKLPPGSLPNFNKMTSDQIEKWIDENPELVAKANAQMAGGK